MKKQLTLLLLVLLNNSLTLDAQDQARYPFAADYYNQQLLYNPAFAGNAQQANLGFSVSAEKRDNYSPYNINGFMNGKLSQYNLGVGLMVQYHVFDDFYRYGTNYIPTEKKLLKLGATSSLPIPIGDFKGFYAGFNIGAISYQNQQSFMSQSTQPFILYNERRFKLNIDIGLLLQLPKLQVGLSFVHLSEPKFHFFSTAPVQQFRRNMIFTAQYAIKLNDWLTIVPTTMQMFPVVTNIGNSGMLPYIDLGVLTRFRQRAYFAVHYKINDDKSAVYSGTQVPVHPISISAGLRFPTTQITLSAIPSKKSSYLTNGINGRIELSLLFFLSEEEEEEDSE